MVARIEAALLVSEPPLWNFNIGRLSFSLIVPICSSLLTGCGDCWCERSFLNIERPIAASVCVEDGFATSNCVDKKLSVTLMARFWNILGRLYELALLREVIFAVSLLVGVIDTGGASLCLIFTLLIE